MEHTRTILVVTLDIRRDAIGGFERYENHAAVIMLRYGGRIERVIRLQQTDEQPTVREIHIVSFPDEDCLAAYRKDDELVALKPLREAAILHTEIVRGRDCSVYGSVAS
jgi:uncharacterized protein (DUF1330 family)